jgi:hypothetical protein
MSEHMEERPAGGSGGGEPATGGNSRERREERRFGEQVRLNREQARTIGLLESRLREAEEAGFKSRGAAIAAEIEREEEAARRAFADGDPEQTIKSTRRVARLEAEAVAAEVMHRNGAPASGASAKAPPAFTTQTQEWLDENPWFFTDPVKGAAARAADGEAKANRLAPDTPGYWAFIRTRVNSQFPGTVREPEGWPGAGSEQTVGAGADGGEAAAAQGQTQDAGAAAAAGRQAAASGAAPVSRATGSKPGGELRLTAEEVEMAKVAGVTPEQYLVQKVAMVKSGELGSPVRR